MSINAWEDRARCTAQHTSWAEANYASGCHWGRLRGN